MGSRRRQPVAGPARHADGRSLPVDARAQLGQGGGRELGVFGRQRIGEDALPPGQGRGHQGPVGVALGAGQGEGGLDLLAGFDFLGHVIVIIFSIIAIFLQVDFWTLIYYYRA